MVQSRDNFEKLRKKIKIIFGIKNMSNKIFKHESNENAEKMVKNQKKHGNEV